MTIPASRRLFLSIVIIPVVGWLFVFTYLPVLIAVATSFTDVNTFLVGKINFVGLQNYIDALRSAKVLVGFRNAVVFTLLSVVPSTALALFLAILLNSITAGRSVFRTLYFLPVITSEVAVAILWGWFYQPRFGLFNALLEAVGSPTLRWLQDPRLALLCIALMTTWKGLGYGIVIYMAGLSNIPPHFYEAARIDGANAWTQLRYITLPLVRPTTAFLSITGTIGALQVFTPIYLLTKGGPFDATHTIVYEIWQQAFKTFRGGYAASEAMLLFAAVLFLVLIQNRWLRPRWEY